jgi:hypothetical protein
VGHVVHSGTSSARNIDALFFILGWPRCAFHKKRTGTHNVELVFLHPIRSVGHIVHSSASGPCNFNALFFMLGWDRYGFRKKHVGTCYAKFLFFHPVGSAGLVLHSDASRARNVNTLFFSSCRAETTPGHVTPNLCFCIRWDLWVM